MILWGAGILGLALLIWGMFAKHASNQDELVFHEVWYDVMIAIGLFLLIYVLSKFIHGGIHLYLVGLGLVLLSGGLCLKRDCLESRGKGMEIIAQILVVIGLYTLIWVISTYFGVNLH